MGQVPSPLLPPKYAGSGSGLSLLDSSNPIFQAALLKSTAAQMIILGVAYRSRSLEDAICLSNDTLVPKDHAANVGDIKCDPWCPPSELRHFSCCIGRIIDEIVVPMRRMSIDLFEYVALKAIIFFNPGTHFIFGLILLIFNPFLGG